MSGLCSAPVSPVSPSHPRGAGPCSWPQDSSDQPGQRTFIVPQHGQDYTFPFYRRPAGPATWRPSRARLGLGQRPGPPATEDTGINSKPACRLKVRGVVGEISQVQPPRPAVTLQPRYARLQGK